MPKVRERAISPAAMHWVVTAIGIVTVSLIPAVSSHAGLRARTSDKTIQRPAVRLSAGEGHSCQVDDDGSLPCWGKNNCGQLGDGTTTGPEHQHLHVHVALTQGSASGVGVGFGHCTGSLERYPVIVPAHGRAAFVPGAAQVEAEAIIRECGKVVDKQEWTRVAEIVKEP